MTAPHSEVKTGTPPIGESSETAIAHRPGEQIRVPGPTLSPPDSPAFLLERALQLGATVDQLKELVALQREMRKDLARTAFFEALAAFQAECPPIMKTDTAQILDDRGGVKYTYRWAPLDEIERTIRPLLTKHGLSYTWNQKQENGVSTICVVRHKLGHQEETEVKLSVSGSPGMSEHQKVQSTIMYGRRASLTSALGLSTTDETTDQREERFEPITEDQATELNDMLTAQGSGVLTKFLKHFAVTKVSDLRKIDYAIAKELLTPKEKKS